MSSQTSLLSEVKARRHITYEAFCKAFQNGSFQFLDQPGTNPSDSSFSSKDKLAAKRHASTVAASTAAPPSAGLIVFTTYDEDNGSINAHNLHTYFDYKHLFFNEVVTQVMKSFPKEANVQLRTQQQVALLCELVSLNPKFWPVTLEDDYATFLTLNSVSDRDITDSYITLSPLKRQEVIELFEDSTSRRATTWISLLHRLISLECVHLCLPFVNLSLNDERYKQRFTESITPERLNAPSGDGIPLILKLLWTEKRSVKLLDELVKLGLSIEGNIASPSNSLSSIILSSIRSTVSGGFTAGGIGGNTSIEISGGLIRTNSGLGMGSLPQSTTNATATSFFSAPSQTSQRVNSVTTGGSGILMQAPNTPSSSGNATLMTSPTKLGDSSAFFRRGSNVTLQPPSSSSSTTIAVSAAPPPVPINSNGGLPPPPPSDFPRVVSNLSGSVPPPPPPFERSDSSIPLPAPPTLPDINLPTVSNQPNYYQSFQPNTLCQSPSTELYEGTYSSNSLLLEDLLRLPQSQIPPNFSLPAFSSKQYPIISREVMLFSFKNILNARYPVLQTLLHALFDVHPLVKFSPFYTLSDFYQIVASPATPDTISTNDNQLMPSLSHLMSLGRTGFYGNDDEMGLRESITMAGAPNILINQKHNPTSYYVSQHFFDKEALPSVPQIPFPRPPLPSNDIDMLASLHPSLEMVKAVFKYSTIKQTPSNTSPSSSTPTSHDINNTSIDIVQQKHNANVLMQTRDEDGCTPILKFMHYRQILSRLVAIEKNEILDILTFLLQNGANPNDIQLPLRLVYTLLPSIPSSTPANPVIILPPTNGGIASTSIHHRLDIESSDDDDDDTGFVIAVKGGDDDYDFQDHSTPRYHDASSLPFKHNSSSPDHPLQMLPQQYVLTKQIHLMLIHYILSIPFSNNTPVILAAQTYNQGKLELFDDNFLEILLQHNADPNHISLSNDTALRIACRNVLTKKSAIQHLLSYRACARYDGTYRITLSPLYLCLQSNTELPIVRALIYRGAQVNKVVNDEPGPLFHAVNVHLQQAKRLGEKDPSVISFLIQAKANINEVDDDNETVLMKAVRTKSASLVVQTLINNGSNLFFVNQQGKTASDLALAEYQSFLR